MLQGCFKKFLISLCQTPPSKKLRTTIYSIYSKLSNSPIPQVGGQSEKIDVDMVSKKKLNEQVEEEPPQNYES